MAPVVKISFQIFNVDASVSLKSVVLENRDIGLVMCESLGNMTVLKLRATCKAGRTIANAVFCPVKAYKRVGFWLGYGNTDLFLSALVEEGELRLLQHAHLIAHDSGKWDGSRVVWGRKVLVTAATSERIDILDWMHNHAQPKIKMDHKPTGAGLSTTAAARAGHLETLTVEAAERLGGESNDIQATLLRNMLSYRADRTEAKHVRRVLAYDHPAHSAQQVSAEASVPMRNRAPTRSRPSTSDSRSSKQPT